MTGDEVVVHDDLMTSATERFGGMAADIARTAGYQYRAGVSGQWKSR